MNHTNEPKDPNSRRQFLANSALFAGAAAALSSCISGGEKRLAIPKPGKRAPLGKDEPIRIGVIGVGGMGGEHCERLINTTATGRENVQVVAISDVAKPKLDGWVARAKEVQKIDVAGYRDYRELLARPDIHGVLIATPEHQHAVNSLDAIAAGKDVYCEKPMTFTREEAFAVMAAVDRSDLIFQVGTQFTTHAKYHEAKKLIQSGAIGKPTLTQTSYCRNSEKGEWLYDIDARIRPGEMLDWEGWLGPMAPRAFDTEIYHRWRRYKRFSHGIVGDLLVHQMTPLIMALDMGWPTHVSASGGHYVHKDMNNHDQVFLTIQFEKEHTMVVAGSTCNELGLETIIRGHKANLFMGGNDVVLRPERIWAEDIEERTIKCPGIEDQQELRLNWLSCIRSRNQPISPVELGTKVMVVVDLAVASLWTGHAYRFDPETMEARRA